MAQSIYDTNFLDNYTAYRNKQRLAGGQIDPRMVGALAEADLSARYSNQDKKKALSLQEQQMNNQTAYQNASLAQQGAQFNKSVDVSKQNNLMSTLFNAPNYAMSLYKMGTDAGLWGAKQPTTQIPPLTPSFGTPNLSDGTAPQSWSPADVSWSGNSSPTYNDSYSVGSQEYDDLAKLWDEWAY